MNEQSFFFDNAIIPTPKVSTRQTKNIRVLLDSRFRDTSRYPNTNAYVIELTDPIERVISAKLLNYNIPSSTNMVNASNNALSFTEDPILFATDGSVCPFDPTNIKNITVPSGNYQPAQLATQIQNQINAVSQASVVVTYDSISQIFSFQSDLTNKSTLIENLGFSLIFTQSNTIARTLGFYDNTTCYGALPNPVTLYFNNNLVAVSTFGLLAVGDKVVFSNATSTMSNEIAYVESTSKYIQLKNVATANMFNGSLNHGKIKAPSTFMPVQVVSNDYVILEIDPLGSAMNPTDQPVGRAFAILNNNFINTQLVAPYERTFTPPLNAIQRFRLSFKNYDGQLCDFENNENFVELLLMIEKHPHMY